MAGPPAEVQPPPSPSNSACYVVELTPDGPTSDRLTAFHAELPEDMCRVVASTAASWRDQKYIVRHLADVIRHYQIAGMAIVYQPLTESAKLKVPQPLNVFFEPVELDQFDDHLQQLMESNVPMDPAERSRMKSSRMRWFFVRMGVTATIALQLLLQFSFQFLNNMKSWKSLAIVGACLVIMIMAFGARFLYEDRWMLVPGGVLIRKSFFKSFAMPTTLYTPADSTLIINTHQQSRNSGQHKTPRRATIWRNAMESSRTLTYFESAALLAAWQSNVPAPQATDAL